ncbi:hypothetical protein PVAND_003758 [Polypedilum vanderplanki]|uniref:Uncharacterized protein n=1 Tax=Polypedilum vanderplanki TaxID=319348 RepID=A0A9J6BVJ2_POLVA|nr:hypothetical protein PVAND_003758 [Polypedilum vanderplanki]
MMLNKFMFQKFSFLLTIVITVSLSKAQTEECGHEELNKCSLQVNRATELNFAPKREELAELCPDLENGLKCIRSYTRRCMDIKKRQQFMKLYKGTEQIIRDLCIEGQFQNEFLKHAACLQTVRPQHQKCALKYQETIASIGMPKANHTTQIQQNTNEDVKKVCCSFREYLDCSEDVTRRTCGYETGMFIRGFLKKMSNTLEKDYCDEYYRDGVNHCPNIYSSATSIIATTTKALFLPIFIVLINLR